MVPQPKVDDFAIEIRTVSMVYWAGASAFTALHSVDVAIRDNECLIPIGPSDCGKTIHLRLSGQASGALGWPTQVRGAA